MNPFKKDIQKKVNSIINNENQMQNFHFILMDSMGLNKDDVEDAVDNDMQWDIGDYWIRSRRFCHARGWLNLLYAVPLSMGTANVGWSNIQTDHYNPSLWFYRAGGTSTIIYPIGEEAHRVIKAIHQYKGR